MPVSWYPWFVPRCRGEWGKRQMLCGCASSRVSAQHLCGLCGLWSGGWPVLTCSLWHRMVYRGIAAWMVSLQNHSWLETSLCAFEHVYPQPRVSCTQLNPAYGRKRCFFCSALCRCDKTPEVNSLYGGRVGLDSKFQWVPFF